MTNEEAVKYGAEWLKDEYLDAKDGTFIKMSLEALRQEPCEDCISRQDVLDLCDSKDPEYKVRHFKEDVECLPSVTPQLEKICVANTHFDEEKFEEICKNAPLTILDDSNTPTIQLIQPKTGRWIDNHNNTISCDRCHTWFNKDDRYGYMHYCPNCRAKMEVEE